jgi:CRP/FNR family cyclic AMP-dependent transcriptional regulator
MNGQTLSFNSRTFLKRIGTQMTSRQYQGKEAIYSQGDVADTLFCIQTGNVKLEIASGDGKKAVTAILGPGDVFGEGCLGNCALRLSTARAIQPSTIARVNKGVVIRLIQQEPAFAKLFISYTISRMTRIEEDFVDRLFNFSEKRLARTLLLLTHFDEESTTATLYAGINQQHLAQMVGTTRSRVSHFMNKFRRLGFVDYKGVGQLTVNSGLLSVLQYDHP